jgi:hypothetical protein
MGSLGKTLSYSSVDFVGFGEALFVGEGLAVVDDDGGETGQVRDLREALRHVAAAEDKCARLRYDGLDENV